VVAALACGEQSAGYGSALRRAQDGRWRHQRRSLGLLVLCSLLVGCLIPISLGLFTGFAWLGALVTLLVGVAGLLLLLGAMLLLAAEGQILTSVAPQGETTRLGLPLQDAEPPLTGGTGRQAAAARRKD
jgi:hypothetical protein